MIKLNGKKVLNLFVGRLSEDAARIYAAEIITVLETIHTNNVMHRDLKTENILMTTDYHTKIVRISVSNKIERLTLEMLIT